MAGWWPAGFWTPEGGGGLLGGLLEEEALLRTQTSGFATFFSRTRQRLWTKGETSGNRLAVRRILVDCDADTLLLKVTRTGDGNVCHTGARSCFFKDLRSTAVDSREP